MAEQEARSPYTTEAEYWKSAATRAWAEQHERQDRALAGLAEATLGLAAPRSGERVLDIGCGSGTTILELAARVGPDGHVLGADISSNPWRERVNASPPPDCRRPKSYAPTRRATRSRPVASIWRSRASASCSSATR